MSFAMKVIGVTILAVIAVVIAVILFQKGLINPLPPFPESTEKARFLRVLSCSYAMCVKESCDATIVRIIGFLDKEQKTDCYTVCQGFEEQQKNRGIPTGHKCGSDYKLSFTSNDAFTYNADKKVGVWGIGEGIETDVIRYSQWHDTIQSGCDDKKNFCKYDHGLAGNWPQTKCEGILEKSTDSCKRMQPASDDWTKMANTGHLWVGPDLGGQCEEFSGEMGYFGNPLYANCTFNQGQTIHIWTELDLYNNWPINTEYCPELILCSS